MTSREELHDLHSWFEPSDGTRGAEADDPVLRTIRGTSIGYTMLVLALFDDNGTRIGVAGDQCEPYIEVLRSLHTEYCQGQKATAEGSAQVEGDGFKHTAFLIDEANLPAHSSPVRSEPTVGFAIDAKRVGANASGNPEKRPGEATSSNRAESSLVARAIARADQHDDFTRCGVLVGILQVDSDTINLYTHPDEKTNSADDAKGRGLCGRRVQLSDDVVSRLGCGASVALESWLSRGWRTKVRQLERELQMLRSQQADTFAEMIAQREER
ncbi:MAG: hypothetical protein ACOC0P_08155, partial [Planctomycetota bacterium]